MRVRCLRPDASRAWPRIQGRSCQSPAHPPLSTADSHLVIGGKFLEQIDVGHQSRASEDPLEEIVTQERVLGDAAPESRLECVDVVDPLSRVGPLVEQVLVHIGDRTRIGVNATRA